MWRVLLSVHILVLVDVSHDMLINHNLILIVDNKNGPDFMRRS